jgi:phosphoglycolate phosphatase
MIKLVIFDLDGTLLNTLQDLADCTNYILRKKNYPKHPLDSFRYFVGNGIRKLIERAIPESERIPEKIDEITADFMAYYHLHNAEKTAPYKGIIPMLTELNRRNILIAVASNKAHEIMTPLMEHYFPGINFAAILGNRQGVPTKPDPAIVKEILQITGISEKETLYAGDTSVDMNTATAAGLAKIGVLWGFRTKEELVAAGADYLVEKPEEILKIIGISNSKSNN